MLSLFKTVLLAMKVTLMLAYFFGRVHSITCARESIQASCRLTFELFCLFPKMQYKTFYIEESLNSTEKDLRIN